MKNGLRIVFLTVACLLLLGGCACEHSWAEADCVNARTCMECQKTEGTALGHDWIAASCDTAKTCSRCAETEGEPLGHTPGEWAESTDAVAAMTFREQYCTVCEELMDFESASLDTLVQDDCFLFSPEEFMERLAEIAEQYCGGITYEFISGSAGLQTVVDCNGKLALIQFFHPDTTALAGDETDASVVWCVNLAAVGESNADLRQSFFMACDPMLDMDTAYDVDIMLTAAYLNAAAAGEFFGYYQQNGLLYENSYLAGGALGQDDSLSMVNIYASDFR